MGSSFEDSNIDLSELSEILNTIQARVTGLQELLNPNACNEITPLERAEEYYRNRRSKIRLFESPELIADPAWDILIDLFIAYERGIGISISSACIASAVPTTTALRWLKLLEDAGHILRTDDPSDARRGQLYLSEPTADTLRRYFST